MGHQVRVGGATLSATHSNTCMLLYLKGTATTCIVPVFAEEVTLEPMLPALQQEYADMARVEKT